MSSYSPTSPSRTWNRKSRASSVFAEATHRAKKLVDRLSAHEWPSPRWQTDPVGFVREVLGIRLLAHQVRIIEAIRDFDRVAIASGQKIGKTAVVVIAALWWFCSFPNARVIMTARTDSQVNAVLYRELRLIVRAYQARTGRSLGELGNTARSGLVADDLREIKGQTAREVEAFSGTSGGNIANPGGRASILYLVDEASGCPQDVYEALDGNLSGGGKLALISNPTRDDGPFFDSFHSKKDFFWTWQINSEDIAKEYEHLKIPGLVDLNQIRKWKDEYGEDSPFYQVRVKGQFAYKEKGKVVSLAQIIAAQEGWADAPANGRLHIGLDPAGAGVGGDETLFALRRGHKLLSLIAFRGLTAEAHLAHLLGIIRENTDPRELPPIVKIDSEGAVGAEVYPTLSAHLAGLPDHVTPPFVLVRVRAGERAQREPFVYDRTRDELWASASLWLRDGGKIPEDAKLAVELHTPEWLGQVTGRMRITDKKYVRKRLGRSPDRADAFCLSVWEVPEEAQHIPKRTPQNVDTNTPSDPYAIADQSYRKPRP